MSKTSVIRIRRKTEEGLVPFVLTVSMPDRVLISDERDTLRGVTTPRDFEESSFAELRMWRRNKNTGEMTAMIMRVRTQDMSVQSEVVDGASMAALQPFLKGNPIAEAPEGSLENMVLKFLHPDMGNPFEGAAAKALKEDILRKVREWEESNGVKCTNCAMAGIIRPAKTKLENLINSGSIPNTWDRKVSTPSG